MTALCAHCATERDQWLDHYSTPQPRPPQIQQIGRPATRHVIEDRHRKADDKARLVRAQIARIRDHCHRHHQGDAVTAPYYEDEHVTLYHGDCLDPTIKACWAGADVLVTDPPYGMRHAPRGTYDPATGHTHKPAGLDRVAGDSTTDARDQVLEAWGDRPAIVFGTWRQPRPTNTRHRLIWWKQGQPPGPARASFMLQDEEIYILGRGWAETSPPMRTVIPTAEHRSLEVSKVGHPTPKPVSLMELLIERAPAGIITDPFAGSGATLIAARNLRRHAVGVELEERYCEIAAKRLAQGVLDLEVIA